MSSRIEVELTSQKPDGVWTWRAAGAKEPRGTLDGSVLYEGAKVGDVVRAEVVFEMDGILVESVYAPKAKRTDSSLIQIASKEPVSFLTRTVSGRDKNKSEDRRGPRDKGRQPRGDREQGPDRGPSRPRRPEGRTERSDSRSKETTADRTEDKSRARRSDRPVQAAPKLRTAPPRFKKLSPGNTHRAKTLEGIAPEHLPIAEQLLKGGIPAVRQALASQNEKAIAEGKPTVPESTLLAIAEPMLPALKLATWKDRAEEAIAIAPDASLRDLRSVISAGDLIRHDDTTREMLDKLKELTQARASKLNSAWLDEIKENLASKRIIRAVRLSSRPPEPTAKLPAEVLQDLTNAVNEMMSKETPADRWIALLDALSQSPIRRQVQPSGLPENAPVELIELAKENSGRIPALAPLLGVAIPPPPRPRKKIIPAQPKAASAQKTTDTEEPGSTQPEDAGDTPTQNSDPQPPVDNEVVENPESNEN